MMLPIVRLAYLLILHKMEPKPAKRINEFIVLLAFSITYGQILAYKITGNERFEILCKIAIRTASDSFGYLFPCIAAMTIAKSSNNTHACVCIIENGIEEPVEFIAEFWLVIEKQCIDILSQTK